MRIERIGLATLYLADNREVFQLVRFDAVVTDPPYGVGYAAGGSRMQKVRGKIHGDETPPDVALLAGWPAVIWGRQQLLRPVAALYWLAGVGQDARGDVRTFPG
jgi:tRNA G10  N-methylase Trm11